MSNPPAPTATHLPESKWRILALVLLPMVGILLVVVAIYLVRPHEPGVVTVVYTDGASSGTAINTGEVLDATDPKAAIVPRLGYRYKVFIGDESDDRSSGIARLGGRVTFIANARRGQTAVVDLTRIGDRVNEAVLVKVLSEVAMPPKAPPAPFVPPPGDPAAAVVTGAEMDVIISEASSKNPETEGVAKVHGLVVFVNGVTAIGQRVNVKIVERRERVAFAEPTGQPAGGGVEPVRRIFQPRPGDPVMPGAIMDVVISEASLKNPDTEGVARVQGLVVFVRGVTQIGQRVNVRIVERRERVAVAEPTSNPPGQAALTSVHTPGEAIRRAFTPRDNDPTAGVIAGAEMDVVITEASTMHPDTEGVARVHGLVVFVSGATTIGERVNVRITARRERMAFAELTGKPAAPAPDQPPTTNAPPPTEAEE